MTFKVCKFLIALFFVTTHTVYGQAGSGRKDTVKRSYTIIRMCSPNYPKKAEENNIEGTVVVQFDMDSNCMFVNFRILKSLGYGCDEETIKAIKCKVIYRSGTCPPLYNLRQAVIFTKPKEE